MTDKRVLIVEDSPTEALRARLVLERQGYRVSLASDGKEGLIRAIEEKPDLIILDTIMPRMGGYEMRGRLMLHAQASRIPVVMLISQEEAARMDQEVALDPLRFLAKPYDPDLLVTKVNELLRAADSASGSPGENGVRAIVQALDVGWVLLADDRILSVNQAAEAMFELDAQSLVGRRFADFIHDDRAAFSDMLARAAADGKAHGRFRMRFGRGTERTWRIAAAPVAREGRVALQLTCLDVSEWMRTEQEIKRYDQELQRARQTVAAAHRAKSDLMAILSHELLTPLHELIGLTDLVLETDLTPEQRNYLTSAKKSADALQTLVKDVLDYSDADVGRLSLEEQSFDLWEMIENTAEVMRSHTREKGLEFSIHIAPDVPRDVVGDPRRLRQILANLVGNAVQFTERGEVTIHVDVARDQGREVEVHMVVHDTGIGIPQDEQEAVFEAFRPVGAVTSHQRGGLGLGLALSRQLARLMGGRIWVESREGEGNTFHVTVSLKRQERPPQLPAPRLEARRPLRILLAEDSPTNQLIAVRSLGKDGHTVQVAENGLLALQMLEREPFDLVLMDIAMPEMDGLEAARAIRQKEAKTGGHIPIIAMTAFATEEYREKCLEAGMDGYIAKPVSPKELHQALEPFLIPSNDSTEIASPAGTAAPEQQPSAPPVDLAAALEVVGGDRGLLADVVEMSLAEFPSVLAALESALADRDATRVETAAHRLKSVFESIGALTARDKASQIEAMAQKGDLDGGAAAFETLQAEARRVQAFYSRPEWKETAL